MSFRSSVFRLAALALILALSACDESNPSTVPSGAAPSTLRVAGGDGQHGVAGAALPEPIAVVVVDAAGAGVPGIAVRFAVVAGGGVVATQTVASDAHGLARTAWTLGAVAADSQVVEARLDGVPPVRLRAAARPDAPAALAVAGGNGAVGPVGAVLADSLAVTVKDRLGNPVVGLEVAWSAVAGGGSVSPSASVTGPNGVARTRWTLGTRVDSAQTVVARVAGLDSVAFTANAVTAGVPLRLAKRGGDEQRGAAGSVLADSLAVSLLMQDGRPVAGALVTWSVPPQWGTIAPLVTRTDANGAASAVWRVGTAPGVIQATATVDEGTLVFNAVVGADAPASVQAVAGGGEGPVGGPLADSLAVRVVDQYGNPVAGAEIDWSAQAGSGSVQPARSATDAQGIARAAWTLGLSVLGTQTAHAVLAGLSPVAFSATASTEGVPLQLAKRGGDGQRGAVGSVLVDSLGVALRTHDGRPVAGVLVTWSVPTGAGTVTPATSRTDVNGAASTSWRLGMALGLAQATATVDDGTLIFTSLAEADAPAAVAPVSGGGEGPVGGVLADPLTVRVTDRHGNPVPGAGVAWVAVTGGGSVKPAQSTTDAQGIASAQWTLGLLAGVPGQTASATVGTLVPAVFSATASTAGVTLQLARTGGDAQTGHVGSVLPDSLTVQLRTPGGEPVEGATVTWAVTGGGGEVVPATSRTDAQGRARTGWTMGTVPGAAQASAMVDQGALAFSATAVPGPPAAVQPVAGSGQTATRGTALADSLVARVVDRYGNRVPNTWVRWRVTAGAGHLQVDSSRTDANGHAWARWAVSLEPGSPNRVSATAGAAPSALFSANSADGELVLARISPQFVPYYGRPFSWLYVSELLVFSLTTVGGVPVVGAQIRGTTSGDYPASTRTDWGGIVRYWWHAEWSEYAGFEGFPVLAWDFEDQFIWFAPWYAEIYSAAAELVEPNKPVFPGDSVRVRVHALELQRRRVEGLRVNLDDGEGWTATALAGEVVAWPVGSRLGWRHLTACVENGSCDYLSVEVLAPP
jgi:adhesin/invasin